LPSLISVIGEILRDPKGTPEEAAAIRLLCRRFATLSDSRAQASLLAVIGDVHQAHPTFAPDVLRFLAQDFAKQSVDVKLAALNLAARLVAVGAETPIPLFVVRVCARDSEFDVRDRGRLLLALLSAPGDRLREQVRGMLVTQKTKPDWPELGGGRVFQIGSLSQYTGRELPGYEALPEWADSSELPPESVREVRKVGGTVVAPILESEEDETINFNDFFEDEGHDGDEDRPPVNQAVNEEEQEYEEEDNPDLDHFFDN
jgi:AP-3 complex subunit beta